MNRITIRDIAKLLEVSPSTVSRALKDHPDIGKTTKDKVKRVADELGYFPNNQAVNFRQRKSKLFGLILPELGRFFSPDMVRGIEEITRKKGYSLVIFQSNESLEKEKECVNLCRSFGIDGLLACLTRETKNIDHFQGFAKNNIPVVFVDKVIKDQGSARVLINGYNAAFTAIQYLAKRNYQKIGGIFAYENLTMTKRRKAGFQAALTKHQLPYKEGFCIHGSTIEEIKIGFLQLLKQVERPDAIFTMTDEILSAVIQIIHEEGLVIPKDIAVISISNGYLPYYINPKITFIKHSGYEVGKTAADLLVDLMENPSMILQRHIELETYLVELDSC
ncbi:MAG: LacI family DNA-binding transcriptional regulator [Saprospiraceae bacterium]